MKSRYWFGLAAAVVGITLSIRPNISSAGESAAPLKPAAKLIAEKGVLKPKEVLVWSGPEKPAVGWKRLDNQYFQIDYPECYDIQTSGEETDPKLSAVVELTPGPSCTPTHSALGPVVTWRPENSTYRSISEAYTHNMIFRQPIRLNGSDAMLMAAVLDKRDKEHVLRYRLRWELYVLCSGEMFSIGTSLPAGKESEDRVARGDYSVSDAFKTFASTFRCSKRRR